ncbi:MAG: DNA cytosine methyltransferase [Elusimicrobia bacterium]|nr:DNA cytosine methyltransferase [Elusimicrobiota bacterium]
MADLILGHEPIAAVEWDPYCCQILRERAAEGWFPGLQVFEGDVRLFDPSEYAGRVDIVHAGFPCQDISQAGQQAGVGEGTRSGLYREILRVADVVRPRFLFLENVSAILNNGLGTVLGDLASRGYDGRWCCLRASDVGANHQRDRWWMLAYSKRFVGVSWDNRGILPQNNGIEREGIKQKIWDQDWKLFEMGKEGNPIFDPQPPSPGTMRMVNDVPQAMDRLKAIGNAQVPLQAALAFRLLMGERTVD